MPDSPLPAPRQARNIEDVRRLHTQHFALAQMLQRNYLSPLARPAAILDIGCGTGRWAMEMAILFPDAQVTALDWLPATPTGSLGRGIDTIPHNVHFYLADVTQPLPHPAGSFDFVFMRLLYADLPAQTWGPLLQESIRVLKPGGWLESLEALPYPSGKFANIATIIGWYREALQQLGYDPLVALKLPALMQEAGLQHVTNVTLNLAPSHPQQRELRRTNGLVLIEQAREPILNAQVTTPATFDQTAQHARRELDLQAQTGDFPFYVTYGQRGE